MTDGVAVVVVTGVVLTAVAKESQLVVVVTVVTVISLVVVVTIQTVVTAVYVGVN